MDTFAIDEQFLRQNRELCELNTSAAAWNLMMKNPLATHSELNYGKCSTDWNCPLLSQQCQAFSI